MRESWALRAAKHFARECSRNGGGLIHMRRDLFDAMAEWMNGSALNPPRRVDYIGGIRPGISRLELYIYDNPVTVVPDSDGHAWIPKR